jgi:hypothetical protein
MRIVSQFYFSTGKPKSAALCNAAPAFSVAAVVGNAQGAPNGPAGTANRGALKFRCEKSNTSAKLFACESRTVSGRKLQRHSIILSTDV